ncbi:MAG: hypothetical protein IJ973_04345 [Christensenellaceae bacterium]|nr:hypothetical protein [Christensenellaceae bacterium]
MIEQDTIKLLRECDAGIAMGISAITDVYDKAKSETLKKALLECKIQHEELKTELEAALERFGDDGKEPNPIAKGMSFIKTNLKMAMDMDEPDDTIADLITDGCNMGVKSLSKYLNEYKAADEAAKDIAKKLIKMEEKLGIDMRDFL